MCDCASAVTIPQMWDKNICYPCNTVYEWWPQPTMLLCCFTLSAFVVRVAQSLNVFNFFKWKQNFTYSKWAHLVCVSYALNLIKKQNKKKIIKLQSKLVFVPCLFPLRVLFYRFCSVDSMQCLHVLFTCVTF